VGGAAAYEVTTVADGGTLSGTVRFARTPPRAEPLTVTRNSEACGEQKDAEALIVGPERGVQGGVVLVEGIARGKRPAGDVVVDSRRCVFVSHVTVTALGERVQVRNSDPVLHNPRGLVGKPTVFNLALPNRGQMIDITRRLAEPEVIRVVCGIHPHMSAWLIIHDSPYVAVTDERGAYSIDGIPPGTYGVTLWHEGYRARGPDRDGRPRYGDPRVVRRVVTIAPRGTTRLDFELR
jgi:hypothetical protein